jgi:UDP-N-acetylmuramate-alanine ligase
VFNNIAQYSPKVRLVKDKEDAAFILNSELSKDDVVIIMSVGDFNTLATRLTHSHAT